MHQLTEAKLRRNRSRNLARLIELYEANFFRLDRLVPELDSLNDTVVSHVAGAQSLYLSVTERFKYTTTLMLSYRFEEHGTTVPEPNARIRVYHDVRSVELLSHCRRRRSYRVHPWSLGNMPELDRRWEMNRFLYKWLRYCSYQGHLFLRCTAEFHRVDHRLDCQPASRSVLVDDAHGRVRGSKSARGVGGD